MDEKVVENIMPIIAIVVTWILARIKNPDYGKKDWKCKRKGSAFEQYSIYLICVFILPVVAYVIAIGVKILYIDGIICTLIKNFKMPGIIIKVYMVVVTIGIYYGAYKIIKTIRIFFVPNRINSKTKYILTIICYGPLIVNFVVSMRIAIHVDLSYYESIVSVSMFVFQIVAIFILDGKTTYKNKKMTICMNDGSCVDANVEDVYKKGKWLRIVESKTPSKEKLVVFDDIKSIEYHD